MRAPGASVTGAGSCVRGHGAGVRVPESKAQAPPLRAELDGAGCAPRCSVLGARSFSTARRGEIPAGRRRRAEPRVTERERRWEGPADLITGNFLLCFGFGFAPGGALCSRVAPRCWHLTGVTSALPAVLWLQPQVSGVCLWASHWGALGLLPAQLSPATAGPRHRSLGLRWDNPMLQVIQAF